MVNDRGGNKKISFRIKTTNWPLILQDMNLFCLHYCGHQRNQVSATKWTTKNSFVNEQRPVKSKCLKITKNVSPTNSNIFSENSNFTNSTCPQLAAKCKGVDPWLVRALTLMLQNEAF